MSKAIQISHISTPWYVQLDGYEEDKKGVMVDSMSFRMVGGWQDEMGLWSLGSLERMATY